MMNTNIVKRTAGADLWVSTVKLGEKYETMVFPIASFLNEECRGDGAWLEVASAHSDSLEDALKDHENLCQEFLGGPSTKFYSVEYI
jgi:hypothetical protein